MDENQIDLQLIEATKRGNPKAFEILLMRYQSRISKVIARFVKDPSEMLDVCQEVFIKVYRALNKFRGDSAFYTWLYRIAINTAKNYAAAQGKQICEIEYEIAELENLILKSATKESGTPEQLLIREEMEHILYATLEHLPKELRIAIVLREIEGLSYEKIASIMDCPVGTVRSRIFRARAAIDKQVQPLLQQ